MSQPPPQVCVESSTCGEHASCQASICVCDAGWSQNADFILNLECSLSLYGMYILWGINLALILWVLYESAHIVVARIDNFLHQRKVKRGYTLWSNKGLIAVLIYFAVCMPWHFIMCIAHFVNPETRVGFELLPTLCFFFGKLGLYSSSMFIQGPFLSAALKNSSMASHKSLVRKNYMVNIAVSTVSILVGILPFITYANFTSFSDYDAQVIVLKLNYFVQALALLVNGCNAMVVKVVVMKALDVAAGIVSNKEKTLATKEKIAKFQDQIIRQGTLQFVVYVLMGSIPFLLNKHNYFLPISWLAMPLLGKGISFQITLDAGVKTLRERFGLKKTSEAGHTTSNNSSERNHKATSPMATHGTMPASPSNVKSSSYGSMIVSHVPEGSVVMSDNPLFPTGEAGFVSPLNASSNKPSGSAKNLRKPSFMSRARKHTSIKTSTKGRVFAEMIDVNSEYRAKFEAFVASRFALEELHLYDDCTKYHKLAIDPKTKPAALNKLGKQIVKKYIVKDAPEAVDLPDHSVKRVLIMLENDTFPPEAFDRIRLKTFVELKDNFQDQFVHKHGLENVLVHTASAPSMSLGKIVSGGSQVSQASQSSQHSQG